MTQWADDESSVAWRDGDAKAAHTDAPGEEPKKPVATGADLLAFDVVLDVKPS